MAIVSAQEFFGETPGRVVQPASEPIALPTKQERDLSWSEKYKQSSLGTEGKEKGGLAQALETGARAAVGEYQKAGEEVVAATNRAGVRMVEEPTLVGKVAETGRGLVEATAKTVKSAFAAPIKGGIEALGESEKLQEFATKHSDVLDTVNQGLATAITPAIQKWKEFEANNPEQARDLANIGEILLAIAGEKPVQKILERSMNLAKKSASTAAATATEVAGGTKALIEPVVDLGKKTVRTAIDKAKTTMFGKKAKITNVDDVINTADDTMKGSRLREAAEQGTSQLSLREKWAGVAPDIKNRIQGKHDKLKEYFDVAHARNNYDTLPTPLEFGARRVESTVKDMEKLLSDTGSKIGSFRTKISTYKAPIDQVRKIEQSFMGELRKLNLEIKNNLIRQKPGTIARVSSDSEVKVLQDLWSEFLTFKEGSNLERAIDLRSLFDHRINFAKTARDVSNNLDPLSRTMRAQIADMAARIVGKSEAANLTKYSDFMDAYNQLRSFTDRKAGAEFLLKQALSERGRMSQEAIRAIKEYTGVDLMDDAVMSSLATDLVGNIRQKGQFRQEVAKAGLDVEAALSGNPQGFLNLISGFGKKIFANPEKAHLRAARSQ